MHNFLDFLRECKFEKFIPLFSVVIFLIYREFNRRSQRLIGVFFCCFNDGWNFLFI